MPKINRQFIGYEFPNESVLRDNVFYRYNNLGHRCNDVDKIDLDNYILFAGCSHSFGEALNLEQTFPYIVSKKLNCDYYNLGVIATGLDVMFYNVMMWFATYKHPKLLVLQYPDYSRFSCLLKNTPLVTPYGSWCTEEQDVLQMMTFNEDKGLYAFRNFCFTQLLDTIKVPVVKLVFGQTISYDSDAMRVRRLDYATDGKHHGIETHNQLAETIVDKYAHARTSTQRAD